MSELTEKKIAVMFALFSFALLVFGSVVTGATFFTALIRGVEGALIFGVLIFFAGRGLVDKEEFSHQQNQEKSSVKKKGENLDQTV